MLSILIRYKLVEGNQGNILIQSLFSILRRTKRTIKEVLLLFSNLLVQYSYQKKQEGNQGSILIVPRNQTTSLTMLIDYISSKFGQIKYVLFVFNNKD